MIPESPPTVRPDLIGKTVVFILDTRSHGERRIPPRAFMGEIVAAEAEYAAVRYLGSESGLNKSALLDSTWPIDPEYDLLESGERLEEYLPGYGAVFGKPDYVLLEEPAREHWLRDRAAESGPAG
jgi:hypothetical protein